MEGYPTGPEAQGFSWSCTLTWSGELESTVPQVPTSTLPFEAGIPPRWVVQRQDLGLQLHL